jgi:hypothetical protein
MSKRKGDFIPPVNENKHPGNSSLRPTLDPKSQEVCGICLSGFTDLIPPYPMGDKCAIQPPNPKHKYHSDCLSQYYDSIAPGLIHLRKACMLCGRDRDYRDTNYATNGITPEFRAAVNARAAQEAPIQVELDAQAVVAAAAAAQTPEAQAAAYAAPQAILQRSRARDARRVAALTALPRVYDERERRVFDAAYWELATDQAGLTEELLEADRLGISIQDLRAIVAATEQGFSLRRQDPVRHWAEIQATQREEREQEARRQIAEREAANCRYGNCNIMGGKFRKSSRKSTRKGRRKSSRKGRRKSSRKSRRM